MRDQTNNKIYYNAIARTNVVGSRRFLMLEKFFPDMQLAWEASSQELKQTGFTQKTIQIFLTKRRQIEPKAEWEKLNTEGVRMLIKTDEEYPTKLKQTYDPPAVLYIKGRIKPQDNTAIAVVGTRRISNYAKQVTPGLARELAENRITVISGLALGTDTLAHRGALDSDKGRTIAVLGGGVDDTSIYPSQNKFLAKEIIKRGAIISEFPVGTTPLKFNFPIRNRIVAGMSLGTVVVEAPAKSGALLTARNALEQNREVFAVPGSVYNPNSLGPHNLIRLGAKIATSATDIIEELNLKQIEGFSAKKISADTPEEAKILEHISHEAMHIDLIIKKTNLTPQNISSTLTLMEMKGKVRNLGGLIYVLAR